MAPIFGLLVPTLSYAEDHPTRYEVVWLVAPDQPVLAEAKWVEPYHVITPVKMLPTTLFAASEDILDTTGKIIASKGDELVGLASAQLAACTSSKSRDTPHPIIGRTCLVDADKDGVFEGYFPIGDAFFGYGNIPKKLKALSTGHYIERARESMANAPVFYVSYGWFASLADELVFNICFIDDPHYRVLQYCRSNKNSVVKASNLPGTFELLGAQFRIDAKEGNRVHVKMETPLKPKPLFIY